MSILKIHRENGVLVLEFAHENSQNPMSKALAEAIIEACGTATSDPAVSAVVLTGGQNRSFCAGGDFNEVSKMKLREEVEAWLDRTIGLYVAILSINKPTVAAVEGHAIGTGFQIALCTDWRLGSSNTKLNMWELKHGLACSVGGYMLEKFSSRALMLKLVVGCEPMPASEGLEYGFLNEVVDSSNMVERAVERAQQFAKYPQLPFLRTKSSFNRSFIQGLQGILQESKEAHCAAFLNRTADAHINRVLKTGVKPQVVAE